MVSFGINTSVKFSQLYQNKISDNRVASYSTPNNLSTTNIFAAARNMPGNAPTALAANTQSPSEGLATGQTASPQAANKKPNFFLSA